MAQAEQLMETKDERETAKSGLPAVDNTHAEAGKVVTMPERTAPAAPPPASSPVTIEADAKDATEAKPNNKRKKARVFGLALLVIIGAIVAWYPLSDHYAPFASGASITAQVTQVAPRVSGPVKRLLIADNAEVKAGQPLFEIDDTTFVMDVAQAKAQLDQAMNSVTSSVAAIPASEAKVEQTQVALQQAEQELERNRQLLEKGIVTQAKFNTVEANYETAKLNVDAAIADLERVKAAASTADADNPSIRAARAALDKAEFALAQTVVVAPADGYITNLALAEGQYVAAGTPALTFINPATAMVIADLRENQLINVEPGDKAVVMFEGAPGRQFEATVDSIAWGIYSGRTTANGLAQPSTDTRWFPPARKIPVRVTIDDPESLPRNVRLGSEASVLIIPEDGIIQVIARTLMGISGFMSGFN